MADQPWQELPAQISTVLRAAHRCGRRRDDRRGPHRSGLLPAARRSVRGGYPGRRAGGAASLPGRDRGLGPGGAPRRLPPARPRRDAGRAHARLAAERLSRRGPRGLAAVCRHRRAGRSRARDAVPARRVDLRLHRRAVGESAEGHALEQSVAAGEAQLYRRRLVRLLVREPPPESGGVESAAREAGWALPRTLAVLAIAGTIAMAPSRACPPMPWPRRSASSPARSSPTPRAPGAAPSCSARCTRRARGRAWASPWAGPRRRSASTAPGRRWRSAAPQPGLVAARDRAGELLLRADPMLARRARARTAGPAAGAVGRAPGRASRRRWPCGWPSRVAPVPWPRGWASIPRPPAIGSRGCASCSAPRLDDPDQRFWLDVALRVQVQQA